MSETDMDWPLRRVDMSLQMDGTYSYGLGRLGRPGMSKPWVRLRPEDAEAINAQAAEGLAAEHRLAYAEGRTALHDRALALIEATEAEADENAGNGNYTYATICRVRAQGMRELLERLKGDQ